ncbi:SixA phosphatase family protein [Enterovirga rhinocerotis]|uniref:Phosphohistidine phosphatase n=1 Tax=Enterovirga rhinocerotis TaxID=1339210 RepID=A0A4R7BMS5_9HYPH|nr:histidine phosphatase family protein [Enterovirga rhinocerotis]TDR85206.1 phosphohistidine phosphatase [Enterovirga rhinocerotis]
MKRLILLRHAKAVPHGTMPDFDRVLAERGQTDMALIAGWLAASKHKPELALVSPSARTRETWALAGLPEVPVTYEPAIYEAEAETLAEIARKIPDEISCAVMVGHNPSFADFALALRGARDALDHLPTAGIVVAKWRIDHWSDLEPAKGKLKRFVAPANLREDDGD